MLPCILYEDEHLLVVYKPAGMNTHAPSPFAGEGLFEWLRDREPRWSSLAIMHRLDKQTSGVLVFALSRAGNRSLTGQFATRKVRKTYLMVTDRLQTKIPLVSRSTIQKAGDRFVSRPWRKGAELAETHFEALAPDRVAALFPGSPSTLPGNLRLVLARPVTGRSHQIRLHAASEGFPVLGDDLYGGSTAACLFLHAWEIRFSHPVTGAEMCFQAAPHFLGILGKPPASVRGIKASASRALLVDPSATNAFRVVHGASDGMPGCYVELLGNFLLAQTAAEASAGDQKLLRELARRYRSKGTYLKLLSRHTRGRGTELSPVLLDGTGAPQRFLILENGIRFELGFQEGYSVGLFLDQRDNRRRFRTGHIAAGFPLWGFVEKGRKPEVLNTFAYTCAFSVAAAMGGARTTSVDLSKKYLEWGRRNFELNGLPASEHDFICGDVFDWLKRLTRKQRLFDAILLDPPTFSQSREHGVFRAEKDYPELVGAALPLLRPDGVLFASTNAADWQPPRFVEDLERSVKKAGRTIHTLHYGPQPPDFPVSREEPAYLKTAWLRVGGGQI